MGLRKAGIWPPPRKPSHDISEVDKNVDYMSSYMKTSKEEEEEKSVDSTKSNLYVDGVVFQFYSKSSAAQRLVGVSELEGSHYLGVP